MKITIESTDQIVNVKATRARYWRGTTAGGIACHVYVTGIAVQSDLDSEIFDAELESTEQPVVVDESGPCPPQVINELIVMIGHAINANNGRWPAVEKALCDLSAAFVDLAPLAPPVGSQEWSDWNMRQMTDALGESKGGDE